MKYYKLTKDSENYPSYELNKIYPGSFSSKYNLCDVGILYRSNLNSGNWKEVPASEYYVQEGIMPEYFTIKKVEGNPLWQKYIDYLNDTYNTNWGGYYFNFYGYDNSQCFGGTDGKFSLEDFKNNPIELTLEQWDKIINKNMEKEFILPKKWYITTTEENNKMVCDWKDSLGGNTDRTIGNYYTFEKQGWMYYAPERVKDYTEITTEQFIKYVLKQTVMEENKEIIGWKLKEDCKQYENAALQIIDSSMFYLFDGYNFAKNSQNEINLKKAGVLELWFEPVHKEEILKFGGYDVTFEKVTSGVRISCNGEIGTCGQIKAIYNYFKPNSTYFKFGSQEVRKITYGQNGSWNLEDEPDSPTEIKIGCTTGTWDEFVAIYEKAKSML